MEIEIEEFAFFIKMIEDRLDQGVRTTSKECLEMYRHFVVKIHDEQLEDLYPFFKDCAVGGYKLAKEDYIIVEDFMCNSKKINAIKHMRAATGIGLKEAKQAVEETFPGITDAINPNSYSGAGHNDGSMISASGTSKWPAGTNI